MGRVLMDTNKEGFHPVSYSTEETPTGETWIDGNPVYRIVLAGNGNGATTVHIPAPVADTLVSLSGFYSDSMSVAADVPINCYHPNNTHRSCTYYDYRNNTIYLVSTGWPVYAYRLIMEYAKA